MSGKQLASLEIEGPDKADDDGADLKMLDGLSRAIILAVQKSDEGKLTDALRTFMVECRKEPDSDDEEG